MYEQFISGVKFEEIGPNQSLKEKEEEDTSDFHPSYITWKQ